MGRTIEFPWGEQDEHERKKSGDVEDELRNLNAKKISDRPQRPTAARGANAEVQSFTRKVLDILYSSLPYTSTTTTTTNCHPNCIPSITLSVAAADGPDGSMGVSILQPS